MDPIVDMIKLKSSPNIKEPVFFSMDIPFIPNINIKNIAIRDDFVYSPDYVTLDKYNLSYKLKRQFSTVPPKIFDIARRVTNPFEKIGKSRFNNRAAVKLANMDIVFNLTNHDEISYDQPQSNIPIIYCDIAAGPGSFTEYIQWRKPISIGYGMTLRGDLDWNPTIIDFKRFNCIYGDDNSGDLLTQYQSFITTVNSNNINGVDLVTADGGFDVSGSEMRYRQQETLSTKLIIAECLIAVSVLRKGGNFICKVFDTVSKASRDLILLMSLVFERIYIFKPMTSRPANSERYLICKNKRNESVEVIKILRTALNTDGFILSMIDNQHESFDDYFRKQNEDSFDRQIIECTRIINMFDSQSYIRTEYNINKALKILMIPEENIALSEKIHHEGRKNREYRNIRRIR